MKRKSNTTKPRVRKDADTQAALRAANKAERKERKIGQKRKPKGTEKPAEVLELPAPEADKQPKGSSVIRPFYKAKYAAQGGNNTDPIAKALTSLWLASPEMQQEAYVDTCRDNGLDPQRWAHLNPGMKRMNLGNVLRGMIRNGESVKIAGQEFSKL